MITKMREEYEHRLSTAVTVEDLAHETAACLAELAERQQPGGETKPDACPKCGTGYEPVYKKERYCLRCQSAQPAPADDEAVMVELDKQLSSLDWAQKLPIRAAARLDQAARVEQATKPLRARIAELEARRDEWKRNFDTVQAMYDKQRVLASENFEAARIARQERDANAQAARELGELRRLVSTGGTHLRIDAAFAACLCEGCKKARIILGLASPAEKGGERG